MAYTSVTIKEAFIVLLIVQVNRSGTNEDNSVCQRLGRMERETKSGGKKRTEPYLPLNCPVLL